MRGFFTLFFTLIFSVFSSARNTSASTDYFRSKISGDWNSTNTWESSTDKITWVAADLVPDNNADSIWIRNGHTVTMSTNVTADELIIENGGVLVNNMASGNIFTLFNGPTTDDLEIQSGGVYQILSTLGYAAYQTINASAKVRIKTGGIIRVGGGTSLTGADNHSFASTSTIYVWEDGAIFDWNNTGAFKTDAVIYFPDASTTTFPIFRVSVNVGNVGAGTTTTWNGIFEAIGDVPFVNSGDKFFRNGIQGGGTITASTVTGQFKIWGTTAVLGGGTLIPPSPGGLGISAGTTVTMTSSKYINGSVDMTAANSHINLGNYDLTVSGKVNISVVSSWVRTNGTGKLTLLNVGTNFFTAKYLPVGVSTVNPIFITSNPIAASYSARVVEPVVPSIFDPARAVLRTWYVTASANGLTPSLGFGYTPPGDCGGSFNNTGPNCQIGVHPNSVWNIHQSNLTPQSFTVPGTFIVTGTSMTYFTAGGPEIPFAVANNGAILPLDFFIATRAQRSGNNCVISWRVEDASIVNSFEVQRSTNGNGFVTLGTITPAQRQQDFSFTDASLEKGTNIYRVKVNQFTGEIKYSNTVALVFNTGDLVISSMEPNPAHEKVNIVLSSGKTARVSFEIIDAAGRKIRTWSSPVIEGTNNIPADLSSIPAGVYHLIVSTLDARTFYRFVKN